MPASYSARPSLEQMQRILECSERLGYGSVNSHGQLHKPRSPVRRSRFTMFRRAALHLARRAARSAGPAGLEPAAACGMQTASRMWPPQHQTCSALIVLSCTQWSLAAQGAGAMPPGLQPRRRPPRFPIQLVLSWQLEPLQVSSLSWSCSNWQRMGHARTPAML